MKILCVLGKHNYGKPSRGEGYEYVNFLPALRSLGHEIIFFESFDRLAYADFAELNRRLLELVQREKPEVIFTVLLGYEVWLETLQQIREQTPAILINWATDDSWKYEQFSRWIAEPFHVYATTSAEALEQSTKDGHNNFVLTQWAAASNQLQSPVPAGQCRYTVSFIGTAYGNRLRWISKLAQRGVEVQCFGHGWSGGAVGAADIPEIIRGSLVTLNFGDSGVHFKRGLPYRSRQIKARVFEVTGAGGMLLTEPADHLEDYLRFDSEIAIFSDLEELERRIHYFIANHEARDNIAKAGHARVCAEHTYEQRFRKLLEYAEQFREGAAPKAYSIDLAQFEEIAKQYQASTLLLLLRKLLVWPCVMLWGRQRGPRAARRILFEMSWRLAGRKTYTATGWPGRLFYRES